MNKKPILLVLGGGRLQKKTILQAEEQGIAVAVVDRDPAAPGKLFSSYQFDISSNDYEQNLKIARDLGIKGVLTIGTDQPILVASKLSHELNLPSFITPETALLATNKEMMKSTLSKHTIPTARHVAINGLESKQSIEKRIKSLHFPLVIKPVDSQGQRGVSLVYEKRPLYDYLAEALQYSKIGNLIVEEYHEGYEVTANAWVYNGKVHLLALTDRVTYFNPPRIGVCLAHVFPSKHGEQSLDEIKQILQQTVGAFCIDEGPLYVQIILSNSGPLIVELACRIGGGHEEDLIPVVSGIDVRQWLIDFVLKRQYSFKKYDFTYDSVKDHCAVFFIAAKGNDVPKNIVPLAEQVSHRNLLWGEFYLMKGSTVNALTNATDRIGAFLVTGEDRSALWDNAQYIYKQLKIPGKKYKNLIGDIFSMTLKGV